MPQPPEFASWADGAAPSGTVVCRLASKPWFLLLIPVMWAGGALGLSMWRPGSMLPEGLRTEGIVLGVEATPLILTAWLFALWLSRWTRVEADGEGLLVSGLFERKRVRWEEVTDYYLRWSCPAAEPLAKGEKLREPWRRLLRTPKPERLFAALVTPRGKIWLSPGFSSREDLARLVRTHAYNSSARTWECREYRLRDGVREFVYAPPSWFTVLDYAGKIYGWLLVLVLYLQFPLPPYFPGPNAPIPYAMTFAGWFARILFLALLAILFRRPLWKDALARANEKILVTGAGLVWEKSGERTEIKWPEIVESGPVPAGRFHFVPQFIWRVRSLDQEIFFSVTILREGAVLPSLICQRAPQVQMETDTVAGPAKTQLQAG